MSFHLSERLNYLPMIVVDVPSEWKIVSALAAVDVSVERRAVKVMRSGLSFMITTLKIEVKVIVVFATHDARSHKFADSV